MYALTTPIDVCEPPSGLYSRRAKRVVCWPGGRAVYVSIRRNVGGSVARRGRGAASRGINTPGLRSASPGQPSEANRRAAVLVASVFGTRKQGVQMGLQDRGGGDVDDRLVRSRGMATWRVHGRSDGCDGFAGGREQPRTCEAGRGRGVVGVPVVAARSDAVEFGEGASRHGGVPDRHTRTNNPRPRSRSRPRSATTRSWMTPPCGCRACGLEWWPRFWSIGCCVPACQAWPSGSGGVAALLSSLQSYIVADGGKVGFREGALPPPISINLQRQMTSNLPSEHPELATT